jgi:hypothetical protein
MGALFSSHAHPPHSNINNNKKKQQQQQVNEIDKAVLDLKNARDRLQRYQQQLERDSEQLVRRATLAKQQGQPKTALQLLKIRRFKEREVESVQQQLLNVLQMVQTVDSQQHSAAILQALKAGKDALHQLHQEQSVDDILKLMDDLQEEQEVEDQVNDILREGVSTLTAQDEETVQAELDALELEVVTPTTPAYELPAVPDHKLPELVPPKQTPATTASERVAVPS